MSVLASAFSRRFYGNVRLVVKTVAIVLQVRASRSRTWQRFGRPSTHCRRHSPLRSSCCSRQSQLPVDRVPSARVLAVGPGSYARTHGSRTPR